MSENRHDCSHRGEWGMMRWTCDEIRKCYILCGWFLIVVSLVACDSYVARHVGGLLLALLRLFSNCLISEWVCVCHNPYSVRVGQQKASVRTGQSFSSKCWMLDIRHALPRPRLEPDVFFVLAVPGRRFAPLKATYWLTLHFLSATRQWFLPDSTPVHYLPLAWPVHLDLLIFCVCHQMGVRYPFCFNTICRPTWLMYFIVMFVLQIHRTLCYHTCCAASVCDRRNPRCRLLGPQQQWGAV